MLVDAIRAEAWRLSRNRAALLWGFFFMPLATIVVGAAATLFTRNAIQGRVPPGAIDVADNLASTAADIANPGVLFFTLIGAAALFAGDYRWETWRLISPRNSRTNLILGKVGVFVLVAIAVIIAMLIASVIGSLFTALVFGQSLAFDADSANLVQAPVLLGVGLFRIVQFAMVGLLTAIVTRSLLATLAVPVVLGVAETAVIGMMGPGVMDPEWRSILFMPGLAFTYAKAALTGAALAPGMAMPDGLLLKAWVTLVLWLVVPLGAALALFNRQDLSKE